MILRRFGVCFIPRAVIWTIFLTRANSQQDAFIAMNIARYMMLRLKTLRGMTVVHVGAHFGQEATRYQNMMARRVVWIEASPTTFQVLTSNISKAKSQNCGFLAGLFSAQKTEHVCINALIGDDDAGQQDFHIFDNGGASNSIFKLNRSNKKHDAVRETGRDTKPAGENTGSSARDAGVDPAEVDVLEPARRSPSWSV